MIKNRLFVIQEQYVAITDSSRIETLEGCGLGSQRRERLVIGSDYNDSDPDLIHGFYLACVFIYLLLRSCLHLSRHTYLLVCLYVHHHNNDAIVTS